MLRINNKIPSKGQTHSFCKEASLTKQLSEQQKRNSTKFEEENQVEVG